MGKTTAKLLLAMLVVLVLLLAIVPAAMAGYYYCSVGRPVLWQTTVYVSSPDGGFGQRLITTNWDGSFSTSVYVGGHGWVPARGRATQTYQYCSAG